MISILLTRATLRQLIEYAQKGVKWPFLEEVYSVANDPQTGNDLQIGQQMIPIRK